MKHQHPATVKAFDGLASAIKTLARKHEARIGDLEESASKATDVLLNLDEIQLERKEAYDLLIKQANLESEGSGGALVTEIIGQELDEQLTGQSMLLDAIGVDVVPNSDFSKVVLDLDSAVASWTSETGARSETATPTLKKRSVTVGEAYAVPAATDWAIEDLGGPDMLVNRAGPAALQKLLVTAVINGSGSNQLTGILNSTPVVTADDASPERSADSIQYVAAPSPDSLYEHIGATLFTLQPQYFAEAKVAMSMEALRTVRGQKDSNGRPLWDHGHGDPDAPFGRVYGKPVIVCDDLGSPDSSPVGYPILCGDFRRGYALVRVGAWRVLKDPYSTIGNIGYWIHARFGGNLLNGDAIKAAQR